MQKKFKSADLEKWQQFYGGIVKLEQMPMPNAVSRGAYVERK
jgi:hypothetical protein